MSKMIPENTIKSLKYMLSLSYLESQFLKDSFKLTVQDSLA